MLPRRQLALQVSKVTIKQDCVATSPTNTVAEANETACEEA
jgi:hypothetical protein